MKQIRQIGKMALLAALCSAAGCATGRFGADGVAYVGAEDLKTAASNGELKKSLAESYARFADEAKG